MRKKVFSIAILSVSLCTRAVMAQQLSLGDLFRMAEEQSEELRIARTGISSATEKKKAARSARLPELDVELSVGYLGDGALGDRDFTSWQHVDNPHFTNNFALKASQVIYSGGAISSGIRLAEMGHDMAELDLKHHRQEVRLLIAGRYLDICRTENQLRVVGENINLIDTLLVHTRARVENGTALETDITRHELQREQLLLARRQLTDAAGILRYQLGSTLHADLSEAVFKAEDSMEAMASLPEWQLRSKDGNAGLAQAGKAVDISEQQLKLKRSELLPKVAIVAENHFDGPITIEVPVIDKNFNYWFVGVGVQYSLSSLWKRNKEVRAARFELRQARERQALALENVNKAVQAAHTRLQTSEATLKMREKSRELAVEHYDVIFNRYQNGLCLLTDMLDAASARLDAETALVNARIDILYNYYQLKYLTSSL